MNETCPLLRLEDVDGFTYVFLKFPTFVLYFYCVVVASMLISGMLTELWIRRKELFRNMCLMLWFYWKLMSRICEFVHIHYSKPASPTQNQPPLLGYYLDLVDRIPDLNTEDWARVREYRQSYNARA